MLILFFVTLNLSPIQKSPARLSDNEGCTFDLEPKESTHNLMERTADWSGMYTYYRAYD